MSLGHPKYMTGQSTLESFDTTCLVVESFARDTQADQTPALEELAVFESPVVALGLNRRTVVERLVESSASPLCTNIGERVLTRSCCAPRPYSTTVRRVHTRFIHRMRKRSPLR